MKSAKTTLKTRRNEPAFDADEAERRLMAQYAGGKTIDDLCAEGKADEPVTTPLFLRVNAIRWAIRRERERQGLTLAALAQAAGIDEPALSRFERGIPAQPRLSTIWNVANALGLELKIGLEPREREAQAPARAKSAKPTRTASAKAATKRTRKPKGSKKK